MAISNTALNRLATYYGGMVNMIEITSDLGVKVIGKDDFIETRVSGNEWLVDFNVPDNALIRTIRFKDGNGYDLSVLSLNFRSQVDMRMAYKIRISNGGIINEPI